MTNNVEHIMQENERRSAKLLSHYDPIRGIGSPMKRMDFAINDNTVVSITEEMACDERIEAIMKTGTLEYASEVTGIEFTTALRSFAEIRCKYDFEFWGATCVRIKTKKDGEQNFVLKRVQLLYMYELEKLRLAGVPIYIILLKARQWGGSTLTLLYMAWIQCFHRKFWNAVVVGQLQSSAKHILGMYEFMIKRHPEEFFEEHVRPTITPYEKTQNYRIISNRECIIGVGSSEKPEAIRSMTYHLMHLTEISTWQESEKKTPEQLVASLWGSLVKDTPYTMCVKETTGMGVGNYFHRDYMEAEAGKTNFKPLFFPWFDEPVDTTLAVSDYNGFISSWKEYEHFLFSKGATVEQIAWYVKTKRDFPSEWKMKQEYPSTSAEAFQTTGSRVFEIPHVLTMREQCRAPIAIGELLSAGSKGDEAFKDIRFSESKEGNVRIWSYPGQAGIEREGKRYTDRYCAFADIGGRWEKADYHSLTILDRIWMLWGGVPRVAAEFHGHMDYDLYAWYALRLGLWYDEAYLAFEINTIIKKDADRQYDGEHGMTVLNEIKGHYRNLFYRVRPETEKENWSGLIGFHTNSKTKEMLIGGLNAALRDNEYEEMATEACDEFDTYEVKDNGAYGAVQGKNDDRVVSRAGAHWLHTQMPVVQEVDVNPIRDLSIKGHPAAFG